MYNNLVSLNLGFWRWSRSKFIFSEENEDITKGEFFIICVIVDSNFIVLMF